MQEGAGDAEIDRSVPWWRLLSRGLARRCARCGSGGLFTGWFRMVAACPRCRLHFADAEGYWVGAMMVNTGFALLALTVSLAAGIALTWPSLPVAGLSVVVAAITALTPVVLYPVSKTVWVALERGFRARLARL